MPTDSSTLPSKCSFPSYLSLPWGGAKTWGGGQGRQKEDGPRNHSQEATIILETISALDTLLLWFSPASVTSLALSPRLPLAPRFSNLSASGTTWGA